MLIIPITSDMEFSLMEKRIEEVARVCYRSEPSTTDEGRKKFLQKLLTRGHMGPFEHCVASYEITMSRAAANQLTRHRLASFCQESQRYVKYSPDDITVTIPPSIFASPDLLPVARDIIHLCGLFYEKAVRSGIRPEDARYFLPLGTFTTLIVTANIRQWMWIFEMRTSKKAQWEIREAVTAIKCHMSEKLPFIFGGDQ